MTRFWFKASHVQLMHFITGMPLQKLHDISSNIRLRSADKDLKLPVTWLFIFPDFQDRPGIHILHTVIMNFWFHPVYTPFIISATDFMILTYIA